MKTGAELPNTSSGCDGVDKDDVGAEPNENMGPEDALVDEPNTIA